MKTILLITESLEPGNFHRGIRGGFIEQKGYDIVPLCCPRDVSFPYEVYDELIMHSISKFHVDILFVIQGEQIKPSTIKKINQTGVNTIVWQVDDPYILTHAPNSKLHKLKLKEYHQVYTTNYESMEKYYKPMGINAKFLPFGYDPAYHLNLKSDKNYKVSFVGSSFPARLNYIDSLAKEFRDELDLFGCRNKYWNYPYRVSHKKMIEIANQSIINLNFSDQPANGVKCLKNRVMEITGSGQFLLSEDFPEAKMLFSDKELVLFSSYDELKEKIKYYLSHDKERDKIARAGHKKTKENYSYKKLMQGVLEDIK